MLAVATQSPKSMQANNELCLVLVAPYRCQEQDLGGEQILRVKG